MSQLNIKGLVDNIKARTNIYTPIIEAVVNSIQAIDESDRKDGEILIIVKRSNQGTLEFDSNALADISSIEGSVHKSVSFSYTGTSGDDLCPKESTSASMKPLLLCAQATIVDATIIDAPTSTKNQDGKRDPEMH